MIHLPFILAVYDTSRERIYYSKFNVVSMFFNVSIWSILISCVLFVGCEVPTARLERMLFNFQSDKKENVKENLQAHVAKSSRPRIDEKPIVISHRTNDVESSYESLKGYHIHL
uniref:Uncharacterized protein n=1 Tax=Ixodes ricinus TaxID=34613 RepID=A0A0K8RC34_IXORI